MTRIVHTYRRARIDVGRIFRWLKRRSPRGAAAWYRAFLAAAWQIGNDAERYPAAEESEALRRDVRAAIFKTKKGRYYRIIFEYSDEEVNILRVRGPSQRPLKRKDLPNE